MSSIVIPPGGFLSNSFGHGMTGAPRYNRVYNTSYIDTPNKRIRIDPSGELSNTSKRRMVKSRRRINRRKRRGIIRKRLPRPLTTRNKIIKGRSTFSASATNTGGVLNAYKISILNFHDPFTANSTNQPLGYDQWATLYKKGIALGCKIKMLVHNSHGTAGIMFGMSPVYPNQGTTALTDFEHYREHAGTVSRFLSPDVDHGYLQIKRSTKKTFSIANIRDNMDDLAVTLASSGPTLESQVHCWIQPFDKSTATTYDVLIEVDYIILLYDPILPTRSS